MPLPICLWGTFKSPQGVQQKNRNESEEQIHKKQQINKFAKEACGVRVSKIILCRKPLQKLQEGNSGISSKVIAEICIKNSLSIYVSLSLYLYLSSFCFSVHKELKYCFLEYFLREYLQKYTELHRHLTLRSFWLYGSKNWF